MKKKFSLTPYLFIAPTFVLILIFSYFAMFQALNMSFTDMVVGTHNVIYVGFQNYIKAFHDAYFWKSFGVQGIMSAYFIFVGTVFPLLAAELLFFVRKKRVARVFKASFIVPMLVPGIVIMMTWRYLFNNDFGFNTLLQSAGLGLLARNWLNDPATALGALLFVGFPYVGGFYFLVFHSGLNNIGQELHDAAIIDGATSLRIAWSIHMPNMLPYISIVVTLQLIGSLTNYGFVLAVTGGGPGSTTMVPALYMYNVGFGDSKLGYASALGVILFLVIIALTIIQRKLFSSKGVD